MALSQSQERYSEMEGNSSELIFVIIIIVKETILMIFFIIKFWKRTYFK